MTDIAPVSHAELAERRKRLRRQRRLRVVQTSWRGLALTGLASGMLWATTLPVWVIRTPNQVVIEGNEFLSIQVIQSLLPIAYPQSLLAIQPQAIAQELETHAPIAEATVTRQLFPPSLTIQITERHPVAIAYPPASLSDATPPTARGSSSQTQVGLLDERGHWITLESYKALNQSLELPTLKVIGIPDQYKSQWGNLYQEIKRSPVKVLQIDWQEPANLVLNTELGIVHFGAYSNRFPEQLRTLDQLRQLSNDLDPGEIAYIDLKNPDAPLIQKLQAPGAIAPPPP